MIAAGHTGWYKIGVSTKDPLGRMSDLQTGNHEKLRLEHKFWSDAMIDEEDFLHDMYAQYRGEGEWFYLPPDEVRWIKRIRNLRSALDARRQGESFIERAIRAIF